ncbi:myelin-oligodendrocyte glycoprotein-like isoform X2 [Trachinotus anak]|uniref:myelin-oligodendrocyte glycoprotein-like isoform X2 n=1 Tax=Trachinotus anak TaxID=443729 RepID=UPI0039F1F312
MRTTGFIFLGVLLLAGAVAAASPNQTIEAEEGGSVLLQCHLDDQVSVSGSPVKWTKNDSRNIVHLYIRGEDRADAQREEFRNRTTLFHGGLSRGNVTLQLGPVRLSDAGRYRCFVHQQGASCYFNLKVGGKDQTNRTQRGDLNTARPPLEGETEPHRPGRRNRAVSAGIISCVCASFMVLTCGILICKKTHRAGRGQDNKTGPKTLRTQTTEGAEDPGGAAGNGWRGGGVVVLD